MPYLCTVNLCQSLIPTNFFWSFGSKKLMIISFEGSDGALSPDDFLEALESRRAAVTGLDKVSKAAGSESFWNLFLKVHSIFDTRPHL